MRRHRQAAPKWRPLGGRLGAERMRMIVTHVKPNYLAPAPSPRLPHRDSAKSAWNAAGPDLDHRLTSPVLPYFTRRDDACVERAADGPFTTVKCPGNAHRTKPNRKSGRGTAELESVVQTTRAQELRSKSCYRSRWHCCIFRRSMRTIRRSCARYDSKNSPPLC